MIKDTKAVRCWDFPRLYFHATIVLALVIISGISRLDLQTSYRQLFNPDSPAYLDFQEVSKSFAEREWIILTVSSKDQKAIDLKTLTTAFTLEKEFRAIPSLYHLDSLSKAMLSPEKNHSSSWISLEAWLDSQPDLMLWPEIRAELAADPKWKNFLIDETGSVLGFLAHLNLPDSTSQWEEIRSQLSREISTLIKKYEARDETLQIHAAGSILLNEVFVSGMLKNAIFIAPAIFVATGLFLFYFLRSWQVVAMAFLVMSLSGLMTLGIQGWLSIPLNQFNSTASVVVLVLSVCHCVHLLFGAMYGGVKDARYRIQYSLKLNNKPVLWTSITTAIGFLGLLFSESPSFKQLGLLVSLGVLLSYPCAIGILPWCFGRLSNPVAYKPDSCLSVLRWLANVVTCYPKRTLATALLVSGSFMLFIPDNVLDENMKTYFKEDIPARQSMDFIEANLTGWQRISYVFSEQPDQPRLSFLAPERMLEVQNFEAWLKQQPEVVHVFSYTQWLAFLNQIIWDQDQLPESVEAADELLAMADMSYGGQASLERLLRPDASQARVLVSLKNVASQGVIDFDKRALTWLKNNTSLQVKSSGMSLVYAHMGQDNIYSMLDGSFVVALLVTILVSLFLRSWKLGLISLLPNLFPPLMMMGLWGLFIGKINMGIAAIFSITFGIIIDDTIHLLARYWQQRRAGFLPTVAVRAALEQVGMAMLATSLMLAGGFLLLAFSDFVLIAQMAVMVSGTVLCAFVFDLLVLPCVLLLWDSGKQRESANEENSAFEVSENTQAEQQVNHQV